MQPLEFGIGISNGGGVESRGGIACQSAINYFKYYNLSKFNVYHFLTASAVSVSDNFSSPYSDSRRGRGK